MSDVNRVHPTSLCLVNGCPEAWVKEYRMCLRHWHRVSVRTRELIHRARVNYWRQCSGANKKHLEAVYGKALVEAMSDAALRHGSGQAARTTP